jgi:hypothetical protein
LFDALQLEDKVLTVMLTLLVVALAERQIL